jgi:hypothetical protein
VLAVHCAAINAFEVHFEEESILTTCRTAKVTCEVQYLPPVIFTCLILSSMRAASDVSRATSHFTIPENFYLTLTSSPPSAVRSFPQLHSAQIHLHPSRSRIARLPQDGIHFERQEGSTPFYTREQPPKVSRAIGGSSTLLSKVIEIESLADQHYRTAYTGDVATIEVGTGPAKRTFYAHCDLLSFYSGYFQAALNGGFAEAQNKVIKLETEEPATESS